MLRQSAVYLPSRVIPGALNFLGLVLYARLLGPAGFGHLTLVVGVSTVVNASALYWVRQSYLRSSVEVLDDRAYRATALTLNAAIVLALSLLAAAAALLGLVTPVEAGAVLLLIAAQNACEVRQEFLRAHERVKAYGMVALVRAVIVLPVALLLLHFTRLGFLAPVFGLAAGGLAGLLYAQAVDRQSLRGAYTPGLLRPFLAFGLPLIPFFVVQSLLGNVDRFLLNHFLGIHAAGSYAAGYDAVQQTIGLVFISVSLAGLPLIFKAHAQGGNDWRRRAGEYGGLLITLVVLIALLLTLYNGEVTGLLLGKAYGAASDTLPYVAWAAVIAGMRSSYADVAFQVSKRTLWQLPAAGVALVLNVVLDILLIPRLGIVGAAIASLVAQSSALMVSMMVSRRVGAMPLPLRTAGQVAVAATAMILTACCTSRLPFVLSAALATLVYLGSNVSFRWKTLPIPRYRRS